MKRDRISICLKRNYFVIGALAVLLVLAIGSFLLGRSGNHENDWRSLATGLAGEFTGAIVGVFIIDRLLKTQQSWNRRELRDSILKRLFALARETVRVPTYVIPRPVPPRDDVDNPIDHGKYYELLELIDRREIAQAAEILPHLFLTPYSLKHADTYASLETAASQLLAAWTNSLQFAGNSLEPHELARALLIIEHLESLFMSCQRFRFLRQPDDQGQTVELLLKLYKEALELLQEITS
jgi:predicted RNase H-like HicB family nuclease